MPSLTFPFLIEDKVQKIQDKFQISFRKFLAWENSTHFAMPKMVSLWNEVWGNFILCHYPDLNSASDWLTEYKNYHWGFGIGKLRDFVCREQGGALNAVLILSWIMLSQIKSKFD